MLRVIIADDHPIVRVGQRVVIEANGRCKVVGEANGPDELLKLLNAMPCDVLVTDFAMPGNQQADGYVLLGLLQRQYPDVPVILVTMFANVATLRASFAQGARAIVAKSASAKELPMAIKAISEGKTFVSENLRLQLDLAGTGDQSQTPKLSGKEREVVRMLASGMTVSQIAARLNRSISTISKQKSTAMNRLCISTDVDLFAYARSSGMVP
ncbi:response regulator transcription factor [Pseudomonas yamanorum]|jgi:two-component system capsular synthesis response regulator RcsB|uniref:Response regulator transcription factor n=1 Tax=Pseudomonas yamanorum TaxID=515393 RepID=A0A7Y8FKB5_9PSED|nr:MULTISPECIES: response regulator transcription factor [Pseudomonas]MCS3419275.1 two-component system capsular synthesis response regulator RcsB [Pseudomonas sp. BIGb0558]MCS3438857.1 two-component system capsular synthesis response regulator RcsB [Pseudomonas sp. BIGb0450]NVZ83791.1 response regulator transcription factor [Pseudomonas yamanorum]NWE17414.1 response regulator transcription factor [Pseudomonas yamanorum]NWE37899.1 response regulator transcription factor [Pseudomonas yamanorum]